MAFSLFLNIILFILLLYINYLSYIKCLSFYQQEHYHLSGFSRYLKKIYLKQWWIHLSLLFIFFHSFLYITLFFCIYFLVLILLNYRERKKIIVHFKITKRMMRFSICYITLFIFILILSYLLNHSFSTFNIASLIIYYFNPLVIFLISLIMMPIEKLIMKKYLIKSKNIIKEYKPIIIAITGSGGKTSIKHMIFDMMKSHEEVYASPKSYNTLNGLCKTINDIYSNPRQKNLKLILEMGASHVHDIEKITKNIIPDYAILSNILPQHLSSFHSMENIIHEKMQIIVRMKDNGICIVNFDNKLIRDNILSFIP